MLMAEQVIGAYKLAPSVGANNYALYSNAGAKSYFAGDVGIGTTLPGQKLTVVGTIESTSGGIKFPDGTVQTTAEEAEVANGQQVEVIFTIIVAMSVLEQRVQQINWT